MEKQYTLPKNFGKKWVKALRSGKYKQGQDKLFSTENDKKEYCCLGVACRIVNIPSIEIQDLGYPDQDSFEKKLPQQLIGTPSNNGLVKQLATLNDSRRLTFPEIADWIETNVNFI